MSSAAVPDSAAHSGMMMRPFDISSARTSPFSGRKPKMRRKICDAVHSSSVKMTKSESTHRVVTSASMRSTVLVSVTSRIIEKNGCSVRDVKCAP